MNAATTVLLGLAAILLTNVTAAQVPATVSQAAEKLDLETLPLPQGAEVPGHRRVAQLSYTVKGPTKNAFELVNKQLTERGWQQLPGAQNNGESVNADYQLDGYTVHLSVSPREPGVSHVMLLHQGNVALEDVPVPSSAEKMYAFPGIVMYKSPDNVEVTAEACRDAMLAVGWSPYGGAGDSVSYRQNAVQVDVRVMSAPAQAGATVIDITSKLLSLEIPAPPFTDNFRYSDGTTAIDFDTDKSPQEVADFYHQQLASDGWKATTDKPVPIKWKQYTIFRNSGQEMITIATHEFEGRTRVHIDHQNATEVAVDELREKIAAGEKAKYRDKEWIPVQVAVPKGCTAENLEDWALKIATPRKKAFATAGAIAQSLSATDWTSADKEPADPIIRTHRFESQDRVIYILAMEPPKLDAWVAVVGVGGVTLEPTTRN